MPVDLQAMLNDANAARKAGDLDKAEAGYITFLSICPNETVVWRELAVLQSGQKRYDEARQTLYKCQSYDPYDALTLGQLGGVLSLMGEHEESGKWLQRALELAPCQPSAMWNYGLHLLKDACTAPYNPDDWRRGWEGYRWGRYAGSRRPRTLKPEWDGTVCQHPVWGHEETLFLWCEQGFGDVMQFCRFVPIAQERWRGKIVLEVQAALVSLLQHQEWASDITIFSQTIDASLPYPVDVQCSLMDLPHALGLTPAQVPTTPYLTPDALKREGYRERVDGAFRVGIRWAGNDDHQNDHTRSVSLGEWEPLNALIESGEYPGLSYHCLQTGPERQKLGPDFQMSDTFFTWDDTAACLANLDLVITVDTGVAHLAGALGVPTWVLVPYNADWRWGKSGNSTLWYPRTSLYRQHERGNWQSVIDGVTECLKGQYAAWAREHPEAVLAAERTEAHAAEEGAAPATITASVPVIDVDALMQDLDKGNGSSGGKKLQLAKGVA